MPAVQAGILPSRAGTEDSRELGQGGTLAAKPQMLCLVEAHSTKACFSLRL
jgi:hypothetical protein